MKICPNCGEQVNDQFKFCPYCASAFASVCPTCGQEVNAKFKFCPFCASSMEKPVSSQPVMPQNDNLFDFSAMEASFDEQLKAQAEYDKKLALAKSYLIRKRYDEARAIYDGLLEENPTDVNVYLGYARLASQNYTVFEGAEIDEAIAAAKEFSGLDNLGELDPQFASYEEKRKAFLEERKAVRTVKEKAKTEETKTVEEPKNSVVENKSISVEAVKSNPKFYAMATVEGTTLKKFKGRGKCIIIPDEITAMDEAAIAYNRTVVEVFIGKNVASIGKFPFANCYFLENIEVDKENKNYQSIDGNLYTKDGKTLIKYTMGKTAVAFKIPDSVTNVNADAFFGNEFLTSVEIGDNVTNIEHGAFTSCRKLRSVVLGKGVTNVENLAFYYCDSLTTVYYKGSASDWNKIAISTYTPGANEKLINAKRYYYSNLKPTGSGNYWHYVNGVPTVW